MSTLVLTKAEFDASRFISWINGKNPIAPPVEIEIGVGRSKFLAELAQLFPLKRFIGLDTKYHRCEEAARLARQNELTNVIYVNDAAFAFLSKHAGTAVLDAIHIYFPSPFPIPDRLLSADFALEVARVLRPGGLLRLATDDPGYFGTALDLFCAPLWKQLPWTKASRSVGESAFGRLGTPSESKYGTPYLLAVTR